jgi:hypothetical protein
MVLAYFVNHFSGGSGVWGSTSGLALLVEKSTPYEKNIPLPSRCTLDTSTAEVCYGDILRYGETLNNTIFEEMTKLNTEKINSVSWSYYSIFNVKV